MKTVFAVFVMIAIVGVGLAYFRGWFGFSTDHDEGKSNVTLSVNSDKVEADKDAAVDKVQDLRHKAADAISSKPESSPE